MAGWVPLRWCPVAVQLGPGVPTTLGTPVRTRAGSLPVPQWCCTRSVPPPDHGWPVACQRDIQLAKMSNVRCACMQVDRGTVLDPPLAAVVEGLRRPWKPVMRLRELAYGRLSQPEPGRWNYQGLLLGPGPYEYQECSCQRSGW